MNGVVEARPALADVTVEGAFAGPELFRAWLLEEERRGRRCVGVAGFAPACPLASFARETLSLEDVYVGPSMGWGNPAQLLSLRGDLDLPEWCAEFIDAVDTQYCVERGNCRVQPRQALDLLERCLAHGAAPNRLGELLSHLESV